MNKKIKEWEQANSSFTYNEEFVYKQIRRAKVNVFFTKAMQLCTCVLALIFVLVNTSPAYIQATKDIPLLNTLNEILNFNPSVNSAIENDYIQELNKSVFNRNLFIFSK